MEAGHPCWEPGVGDGVGDVCSMDVSCRASQNFILDQCSGGVVGWVLIVVDVWGEFGEDSGGAGGGGSKLGFCPCLDGGDGGVGDGIRV